MTAEDLAVLERFEAVWQRVLQGGESPMERSFPREDLLGRLQTLWQGCRQMSRCTAGEPRRCLQGLARKGECAFRSLQTEYFLDSGDIYLMAETCNFASYTPYNLRKLWKHAMELADDLQNASCDEIPALEKIVRAVADIAQGLKELIYGALQ